MRAYGSDYQAYDDGKYGHKDHVSNDASLNERYRWEEGYKERQERNKPWEPSPSPSSSTNDYTPPSWGGGSSDSNGEGAGYIVLILVAIVIIAAIVQAISNFANAHPIIFGIIVASISLFCTYKIVKLIIRINETPVGHSILKAIAVCLPYMTVFALVYRLRDNQNIFTFIDFYFRVSPIFSTIFGIALVASCFFIGKNISSAYRWMTSPKKRRNYSEEIKTVSDPQNSVGRTYNRPSAVNYTITAK